MKKLSKNCIAITLAIMFLFSSISLVAVAKEDDIYIFTMPDGTQINYFLDENNTPYVINDVGEQIIIALPLEHLRVTDEETLEQLNNELNTQNSRSSPTSYFNLTASSPSSNSIKYTQVMSFLNVTTLPTQNIKFYPNHEALSIKTADIYKEHWYSSVKINFVWYYYTEYLDVWSSLSFTNVDCSSSVGKRIQHEPSINTFGKFEMSKGNSGVESFILEIWSTYAW